MTQQSHGQSGQFTWRMGNGVPLTWMHIGTPLWKAGLYRSLFVFLRSEASIRRDCPQLKLRLPELRNYKEKRRVSALQGEVVDNEEPRFAKNRQFTLARSRLSKDVAALNVS